jgi:hypothetical protein
LEERQIGRVLNLCPGDIVEVRGEEEIRITLDKNGTLDGLSFMSEMTRYCGRRFRVLTRVDRMLVEGIGNRSMRNTVILAGVTCDGHANEDCQRTCRILWKEDWLRRADASGSNPPLETPVFLSEVAGENRFGKALSCQLLTLPNASRKLPISFEDFFRQYICSQNFVRAGTLKHICDVVLRANFKFERFLGRKRYGALHGKLKKTPSASWRLQPGELVQVKSKEEILETLDVRGRNRGLSVTDEMLKYCGGRFRVMKRVNQMVSERAKKIRKISNTVILEGVTCDGSDHLDCPRRCYCLWREIWLKRV